MNERIVIVTIQFATALVLLLLALVAWRRRSSGNAAIFLAVCLTSVTIYSFGYGMELLSDTLETAMFWVRFQHLGIQWIAPTWMLFAISVTGFEKRIKPWMLIVLAIIPLYLLVSAQTLGGLNLAHHNPRMDTSGPFPVFAYDRNIWNYIAVSFYSFCLGVSTILFTIFFFRAARSSKKQAIVYLLGSIPPWVGLFLHNLNLSTTNIDYTPLMMGVSGLFFVFGFTRLRILDLIPLARDMVFEKMSAAAVILDREDRIVDFNPAMQAIFPVISQRSIGVTAYKIFSNDPSLLDLIRTNQNGRTELKFSLEEKTFYYRVHKSILLNRRYEHIGQVIIFYEYTKEKELMERLEWIAARDGLTGIFNRLHFDIIAEREIERRTRYANNLSMIMVDLDHFKKINDTYGHAAGDLVLKTVADTFSKMIRQMDKLARFGGEEFVILLPETSIEAATALAERLRKSLELKVFEFDGAVFSIFASFGISGVESDEKIDLDTLYRAADRALYRSKAMGGNTISVALPTLSS